MAIILRLVLSWVCAPLETGTGKISAFSIDSISRIEFLLALPLVAECRIVSKTHNIFDDIVDGLFSTSTNFIFSDQLLEQEHVDKLKYFAFLVYMDAVALIF